MTDNRLTPLPAMNSGVMIRAATRTVRAGLTMINTTRAPTTVSPLRRATEIVPPTIASTMARSVVRRESTSPVRTFRK